MITSKKCWNFYKASLEERAGDGFDKPLAERSPILSHSFTSPHHSNLAAGQGPRPGMPAPPQLPPVASVCPAARVRRAVRFSDFFSGLRT
jgi:hypothetical protein